MSIVQYKLRRILVSNYNLWIFHYYLLLMRTARRNS